MPNTISLAAPTSLYYIMIHQYNSLAISPPCYIDIIDTMIYRGSTNFESRKAPLQSMHTKRNGATCLSHQLYRMKSQVSITLPCRLCSTRYTAVQIKNCLKSASPIKIATITNMDDFHYEGKPSHAITKSTLFAVSKNEWDTLVSP